MLAVVRENAFVREFDWDGRRFLDSKYRTCELPFRADHFVERWPAADEALRADMEVSLGQFPTIFRAEVDRILEFLQSVDEARANRVRVAMAKRSETWPPAPEEVAWYVEIYRSVLGRG